MCSGVYSFCAWCIYVVYIQGVYIPCARPSKVSEEVERDGESRLIRGCESGLGRRRVVSRSFHARVHELRARVDHQKRLFFYRKQTFQNKVFKYVVDIEVCVCAASLAVALTSAHPCQPHRMICTGFLCGCACRCSISQRAGSGCRFSDPAPSAARGPGLLSAPGSC